MKTTTKIAAWALLASSGFAWCAPQPYHLAPEPGWVRHASDAPFAAPAASVEQGDADFLLVDHQVRLNEVTTQYSRFVEQLVSQASVDGAGQLSFRVDPEHEHLLLHSVRVFRGGRAIDKLADARVSLLNREEQLDSGLIDGRVTVHALLRDVRMGDVLDYSFTIERKDPIGARGYHHWFDTQWSAPVRRFRLRVLRPQDRPLIIKDESRLPKPVESRAGEWTETAWNANDIAALKDESERPSWFYFYPRIEISEFADWNAVRDWAIPLYAVSQAPDDGMKALLAELRAEKSTGARILKTLRFVQDDIRYVGLEMGAGAYRPSQPGVVLARRYGDCKDKVLLLVTLLRELGVEAVPALVNSVSGRGVAERLPSPGAFDHVIAKVRLDDRDYWLDATTSGQGGTLDTMAQADFGAALPIEPGKAGLARIPPRTVDFPINHVVETFDLRNGVNKKAPLKVVTQYRSHQADTMRVRLRTSTASEIGKGYLDYYRKTFSDIRAIRPLVIRDDRVANLVEIEENYEIDTPFQEDAEGARKLSFEAYLVTERVTKPADMVRSTPLARVLPLHVRHEVVAYLPPDWLMESSTTDIADPAFEYHSKAQFAAGKLELAYELRNTADHVAVPNLKEFLAHLGRVHDDSFYTITAGDDSKAASSADAPASKRVSLEMILTLLLGLGLGACTVIGVARIPWRLAEAETGAPAGLTGWMMLPVFGVLITPVYMLYNVWTWFSYLGDAAVFQRLDQAVQIVLLLEFLVIGAVLVFCVHTALLMFRRERRFPIAFVVLQSLGIVLVALDLAAIWIQGAAAASERDGAVKTLVTRTIVAAIWITYMFSSERVRATFVEPRPAPPPTPAPPPADPAPLGA